VNCLPEIEENIELVDVVRRNFPHVQIISRARNRGTRISSSTEGSRSSSARPSTQACA
jgi:hypothetical protein